jgi:hypothetical protein
VNAHQKVQAGAVCIVLGSWLMYQGFEGAGRKRPFWTRLLPGG